MIAIYILLGLSLVLTTTMLVLYFVNDKARCDEIEELNKKVDYYINVLKNKEQDK